MAILPFAAGLANELALDIAHPFADGFPVGHLWTANIGLDAELTPHTVNDNLQMQLAHPGDDGLAGLFVGMQVEGGIFCRQTVQRDAHFLLVGFSFWFDGERDHRIRELHPLEGDHRAGVCQGIPGGDIF